MSINDLQNINNFRVTHHYIQVNSANINKQMSQEQNLFDLGAKTSHQNSNEEFLFEPTNNKDEFLKNKLDDNLFG